MIEIFRQYLEIKSLNELNDVNKPDEKCKIEILEKPDFQLNKFFYKQIGKNHRWVDRLVWKDQNWIEYLITKGVNTYILKQENELAGYFEQIFYDEKLDCELAYFGILEEYIGKKLGGYLLSEAIKKSFEIGSKRVWVHTCSLDHEHALKNYLSRGMRIFKNETINL